MNREGKKCVLYPRVSTEMQVDGYSLEGQKNGLKRFADREEMEIVGIYEDAGKSGKSIEGRPAFKKMLSDIKNGLEIDYILVYKLSRFGRNAADILNSLEFVQSYGINLICIEEGIDSSQTSGKLLISVLSAVAEIERENNIREIFLNIFKNKKAIILIIQNYSFSIFLFLIYFISLEDPKFLLLLHLLQAKHVLHIQYEFWPKDHLEDVLSSSYTT